MLKNYNKYNILSFIINKIIYQANIQTCFINKIIYQLQKFIFVTLAIIYL